MTSTSAVSEGKPKILVVDDRPENLLTAKTLLEDLGDVVTMRSGEEALRCLLDSDVAVILLDVNMPGMDGLETARYIRMRTKTTHTPIIFLTAYVEEMHTSKGYALGAIDYILTPVVPQILRTKVKVFVDLYSMREQANRQMEQRISLAKEQEARRAAEELTRRTAFLADASDLLGSSLDAKATAQALTQFVIPFLADFSAILFVDEQGRDNHVELAWRDVADDSRRLSKSISRIDDVAINNTVRSALDEGKVVEVVDLDPPRRSINAVGGKGESPSTIELGFNMQHLVVLPLIVRDRKLGTLLLGFGERHYNAMALALAEDVASRAAVSLDNCTLYERIQEADQRKNEFLAMLAHELRNPLAPVRNAVQLLMMPDQPPSRMTWGLDIIDRQTRHLVRLIDDLLDVARITQGKIELKFSEVDVAAVVFLAVEMNRELIDKHDYRLSVQLPAESLVVWGDHSRVAQILSNLLNNALKYTEPGGAISIAVDTDGANARFRIGDSGIGIPENMLHSIFELFMQADRSLDRSQGGLGVGLTVVQRLVRMQSGSVEVFSEGVGKGSEFIVRLPLTNKQPLNAPMPQAVSSAKATPHRVLVVDDYVDTAESMAALLRMRGHEVRVAHDGNAAIEVAKSLKPHIVFLDIGLPHMNGYEVGKALKAMPDSSNIQLIALTGYGQEEDLRKSRESGFCRHLIKPVDPQSIEEIMGSFELHAG